MEGVLRVNIVNFITVGLMSIIFVMLARQAANAFAPQLNQYI